MSYHRLSRRMVFLHSVSRRQKLSQDRSPLLTLPGEIRNLIYELVLTDRVPSVFNYELRYGPKEYADGSVSPNYEFQGPPRHLNRPPCVPTRLAILQTCRQIYKEASHIYYASHTFEFRYMEDLRLFLKEIGKRRRREITSLGIHAVDVRDVRGAGVMTLLKQCVKLRYLHWEWTISDSYNSVHITGLKAFGELRGLERVEIPSHCWLADRRGADMRGKPCGTPCQWCRLNLEELKLELEEVMTRPHERERLEALRASSRVKRMEEPGRTWRLIKSDEGGNPSGGNTTAREHTRA